MQDARQQGPDKPVSSVLDAYRNQIDRYEPDPNADPVLRVTLRDGSPVTEQQVIDWYWRYVGTTRISEQQDALAGEWTEDRELARMMGY